MPTWVKPGPVRVKCDNRIENNLLVEEVEFIQNTTHFARVRLGEGKEISASLRHVVPNPKSLIEQSSVIENKEYADKCVHCDFELTKSNLTNKMLADRDSVDASVESSTNDTNFEEDFNICRSSHLCRRIDRYVNNNYS